ncbi:MAG: outer membrane beta-barrel protein [Gemmatimonadales bacterium]
MRGTVSLTFLLMLALAGSAMAQERHGFWLNAGLGYGSLGCEDCRNRDGGLSADVALGGTLSPKLQLGVGSSGWYRDYGDATTTVGTLDARLRFYPSKTGGFYVNTGVGVGQIEVKVDGFGSITRTGVGLVLGLGYDFRTGGNLSITPYWSGFAVRGSDANANVGQLGLGITVEKYRNSPPPVPATAPAETPRAPAETARSNAPEPPATFAVRPDTVHAEPERTTVLPPPSLSQVHVDAKFVGDTRLKLFYPNSCAARKGIPSKFQVFFQTAAGAQHDGFKPSADC